MGRYELMTARRLGTADHRNRPDAMSLDPLGAGVRTAPRRIRQPGMVRRERVLRELNDVAEDVPLILVTAPAGFGKTTLLQQWAADDSREFGWVQLDEADNDPARLLRHIALAMHRIRPIDYPAWRSLGPPVDALVETVLPRLLRAAVGGGPPWVLVLDDIHHLRGALGAEAILAFANALPPGYHVVASGRHRAGLRLSGLRRQGRCVEIGAGHLAFRREEVASVLRTAGVPAAPATVDRVLQRTEGWPAGVYLTALSMRGASGRADAPPQALAGTEFIADYLRDEVLRNESEETLRFLRRTAVLEQMSAPLCNAVLLETCSVARLGDLEDRNLFVTRPDPGRLW